MPNTSIHRGVVILPKIFTIFPICSNTAPFSAPNLKPVKKKGSAAKMERVAGFTSTFCALINFLSRVMMAETSVQPMRFIERKYIIEYAATVFDSGKIASKMGTPKKEQFERVVATVAIR